MQSSTLIFLIGLLLLLEGLTQPLLLKVLNFPSPEELFTIPEYRKASRANRRGFRVAMILLGISLIFYGTNGFGIPAPIPQLIEIIAFLGAWAALGALLVINLRAKPNRED